MGGGGFVMKAWDIVGWTFDGAAYCPGDAPSEDTVNAYGDTPQPIFASDDYTDMTCDKCLTVLD